jgi:hypothetical protein
MENGLAKELLDELIPHLETMEAQSAAVLQLLKEKGIATEKDLARYLEEAGKASNVKWRAGRLRIERLLSSIIEEQEKSAKQAAPEERSEGAEPTKQASQAARPQEKENEEQEAKAGDTGKSAGKDAQVHDTDSHQDQQQDVDEGEKKSSEGQKEAA